MQKAVLFDVDGTLLNTHEFIVSAFEYAVSSIGLPITRHEAEQYMRTGKTLRATYAHMLPNQDTELLATRHHEFQKNRFDLVTAFDGAEDVLQTLKDAGYKLAVVTNRARSSVMPTLAQTGLVDFFDIHICMEDTLRPKPDPEHLFTALRALDVPAEYSWMVGDTRLDIEAAHAAGVRSIGISHSKDTTICAYNPEHVVFSLQEIIDLIDV